jgi:site-specific recombinase XerD
MTLSTGRRKAHFKNTHPTDPAVTPFGEWLPENRRIHADFCLWLGQGGYSPSACHIYSIAARFAFGYLHLPTAKIQPEHIASVRDYLATRELSPSTLAGYGKGLNKLLEFLHFPKRTDDLNWDGYLKDIPPDMANAIRGYVTQRAHSWRTANRLQRTRSLLSQLCAFSRSSHLTFIQDLTPKAWFAYVEVRLRENIQPTTLNTTLRIVGSFLRYLQSEEKTICERMLEVRPLKIGQPLPRDLSIEQVKSLFNAIQNDMDRAWFLLMLHSGLRTCEIRNLKIEDIDLSQQSIHIRESKNQRERVVYLSLPTVEAIQAYLANRKDTSEYLFTLYHKPLSNRYCQSRLTTIGKQVNVNVTPHQLRDTCATLLLNAGMSIFALQSLFGHKYVDTTLRYARIYDATVAKDFLEATSKITQVEIYNSNLS